MINLYQIKKKIIDLYTKRKEGLIFLLYNIIGNILTLFLSFILPFILIKENYGKFVLVFSLYNVMSMLFTFGIDTSIIKFTIDKNKNNHDILLVAFLSWVTLAIPFAIIGLVLSFYIYNFFVIEVPLLTFSLVIISSILISFQKIILSYYIAISNIKSYGILFISNKLLQVILFLILFLIIDKNASIIYYSIIFVIQSVMILIYIYISEYHNNNFKKPKKKEVKSFIYFSLPLSLNTLGTIGYGYGYTLLVSPLISLSALGVLNIFNQFGSIISLLTNALNNGYLPSFYKEFTINSKGAIEKYTLYIFYNSIFISILLFIAAAIYRNFAFKNNDNYSIILLSIYILSMFIYSFKSIGYNYWVLREKTYLITIFTLVSSIVNIILGYYGSHYYGFIGCIISLSLGIIFQTLLFNHKIILFQFRMR